jgi:phage tail-like protein
VPAIQRDNPYPNHNFEVSIAGVADDDLGFSEVELPSGEIEVIEYREGRDGTRVRKLPGLVTYPNVTLKRGINGYLELYNWWKSARDGDIRPTGVTIKLLDEQRREVMRWNLSRAWPVKLEAGPLNASANEVAIETLELAHEGFEIE